MSKEIKFATCSLCGLQTNEIMASIKDTVMCKHCVATILEHLNEENSDRLKQAETIKSLTPSEINAMLDEYVIGQNIAKDKLAVAIYNHQKLIKYNEANKNNEDAVEIEKSNIIMVGPTGSGKTYMLKTLIKKLGIPFAIEDATTLTSAGYVGDDVENCLRKLIEAADGDIEKAQKGIIYIDEIDKSGRKGENLSITRDVSGEGVQQALLRLVEGTIVEVPPKAGRKHPNQECIKIDTTNILFIVGGSFEGIEKSIVKRKQGKSAMGFGASVVDKSKIEFNEHIHDVSTADLKKFGMLPEFLGRFPVIATLDELNEEALLSILTVPKNALIKQYSALFELDGIKLTFSEEAIKVIANKAIKSKIGARGLRSILEGILLDTMHSAPDENLSEVIVNGDLTITKIVIEEEVV